MATSVVRVEWQLISDATVASIFGEIDLNSAAVAAEIEAAAGQVPRLLLDLEHVTFVDAVGLRILEDLSSLPNVAVVGISPPVQAILDAVGRRARLH